MAEDPIVNENQSYGELVFGVNLADRKKIRVLEKEEKKLISLKIKGQYNEI